MYYTNNLIEDLNIDSLDIAKTLLANVDEIYRKDFDINAVESAIYNLYTIARNPYNSDCYRQLYNSLMLVVECSIVPFQGVAV